MGVLQVERNRKPEPKQVDRHISDIRTGTVFTWGTGADSAIKVPGGYMMLEGPYFGMECSYQGATFHNYRELNAKLVIEG